MSRSYTVSPWGFDMDVFAEVEPGERPAFDSPGYEPYCIVESVRVGGVEVYPMLDDTQMLRIEAAVMRGLGL
jgi:hypothetical protein